jgi:iron complex outermembrane receptor protein
VTGVCGGSSRVSSFIINAGKGTPKGLEFELETRLAENLVVSAFYNRTLGRYDSFMIPTVAGCTLSAAANNLAGQNFGNISKNGAGLSASYTLPLAGDREELELSGNLYYRSDRVGNELKGFNVSMPGYTLLNARIDYNHVGGSPVSVGFYVRNITNKLYALTRNSVINVGGYDVSQFGDPRTYGIVAKVDF